MLPPWREAVYIGVSTMGWMRRQAGNEINLAPQGSALLPTESNHANHVAYFLQLVVVAAFYFAAAKIGLSLASIHVAVSPVWPPTGVAVAATVVLGYRIWPAILAGAFLANLFTPVP